MLKINLERHWKQFSPEELGPRWSDLDQPTGQALSLHHGRRRCQLVPLDQSACDPSGCRALPGRDDDTHAIVTTSSHGATSGIDHKTDQKPEDKRKGGGGVD